LSASPTVLICFASSSAISISNSSSNSITSSTTSNEPASKSSLKEASIVIADSSTSSLSTIISFTLSNTSYILTHLPTIIYVNSLKNTRIFFTSPCHHQYQWFVQ